MANRCDRVFRLLWSAMTVYVLFDPIVSSSRRGRKYQKACVLVRPVDVVPGKRDLDLEADARIGCHLPHGLVWPFRLAAVDAGLTDVAMRRLGGQWELSKRPSACLVAQFDARVSIVVNDAPDLKVKFLSAAI